jgi:ferritin-like metal-binding protein YciE
VAKPSDSKVTDRVKQAGASGVAGLAASPLASLATRGGQYVTDAFRRRLGKVNAGELARTVAGDKLADIKAANAAASNDITSSQATTGVDRDVWQSLGEMAKGKDQNSYYRMLEDAQEAGRIKTMEAVKPDLKTAIDTRKATTEPYYQAADKANVVIDKNMSDVFKRMPKGVMAKAAEIAKMEGRDFKILNADDTQSITGESLHYIKRALSDKANASPLTGIGQDEINATKSVLGDFINVFENKVPDYGVARKLYAEGSKPVNQSKVIDAMVNTLKAPKGGERVTPFLNSLGAGENALIKRADQSPRFGGIDEILNAPQKGARDKVVSELMRDSEVNKRAIAGAGGLADIVGDKTFKARLPQLLDTKFAVANKVLSSIETKVNKNTMKAIIEGMKSGKNANELLNTLPSGERLKVIEALKNQKATPYLSGGITSMQQGGQ